MKLANVQYEPLAIRNHKVHRKRYFYCKNNNENPLYIVRGEVVRLEGLNSHKVHQDWCMEMWTHGVRPRQFNNLFISKKKIFKIDGSNCNKWLLPITS